MSAFYKFLFPMKPDGTAISLLLLALRLLFGGLLLSHGIQKWTNFESVPKTDDSNILWYAEPFFRACPPHFRTHWELDIRFL